MEFQCLICVFELWAKVELCSVFRYAALDCVTRLHAVNNLTGSQVWESANNNIWLDVLHHESPQTWEVLFLLIRTGGPN